MIEETSNPETANTTLSTVEQKPAVSAAKLAANRENAKKSTGPRSLAAKATSSRNVKHGRYCGQPTMRDECLAPNSKQRALLSQLSMIDRRIDQEVRLLLTLQKVAEERERAEDAHQESDKNGPSSEQR
jgi:hypothetical protein